MWTRFGSYVDHSVTCFPESRNETHLWEAPPVISSADHHYRFRFQYSLHGLPPVAAKVDFNRSLDRLFGRQCAKSIFQNRGLDGRLIQRQRVGHDLRCQDRDSSLQPASVGAGAGKRGSRNREPCQDKLEIEFAVLPYPLLCLQPGSFSVVLG